MMPGYITWIVIDLLGSSLYTVIKYRAVIYTF